MTNNAQLIKTALAVELAKQGKTLDDLETELRESSIQKNAAGPLDALGAAPGAVKGIGNIAGLAGLTALLTGALAGTTGYAAYQANDDSTEKQVKKLQEQQQYLEAAKMLKQKSMLNQSTF